MQNLPHTTLIVCAASLRFGGNPLQWVDFGTVWSKASLTKKLAEKEVSKTLSAKFPFSEIEPLSLIETMELLEEERVSSPLRPAWLDLEVCIHISATRLLSAKVFLDPLLLRLAISLMSIHLQLSFWVNKSIEIGGFPSIITEVILTSCLIILENYVELKATKFYKEGH